MLFWLISLSILAVILACLTCRYGFIYRKLRSQKDSFSVSQNETLQEELKNLKLRCKELQIENDELNLTISKELIEQDHLHEALIQSKLKSEEADILKSNFLANMSHEIRTPMNGILGFAQLLKNEESADKRERYIDIIYHNGMMLVNLIDDIIDISRIDAGQMPINIGECNLEDLMFDVYTFFNEVKFKQEKEHINIRLLNLNDDEANVFYTDSQRLRQVLVNLISNALKFTEKGYVEFGYINKQEGNKIEFFVRDTGIGIPADKKDIIFERFRQVQEGSTRKYGGTGIGLYISKNVVNLLGGDIWFESKEGEGATFYFTLPYQHKVNATDGSIIYKPAEQNYYWKGKHILIAEDMEANFRYLAAVIGETGAEVIWARNGQEVVDKTLIKQCDVDLILMDIQMPIIDGYEATRQIKAQRPNIPIIAQTAYALPHDNIRCFEAGCDDYVSKPINALLLKQKIHDLFNVSVKSPE